MIRCRTVLAVMLACAAFARAADDWSLTTADFKTDAVTLRKLDQANVVVGTSAGDRTVPLDRVVALANRSARQPPVSGLVFCLDDGQRVIGGNPVKLDGNTLVWHSPTVGDVAVPVESAVAVLLNRTSDDALAETRAEDQAKLSSGDTVHGILTDVSPDTFAFTPAAGGDPIKVATKAVSSIFFATPPAGRKPAAPPAFLLKLLNGTAVAADKVTLDNNAVRFTNATGEHVVSLSQVAAFEHTDGPVAWLSSRPPAESVHTPYFEGHFPARFDTTVTGGPIRFGGVTYAHGIGVHSKSKLVFNVHPGDKTFRTRYAIEGDLGRADVDVRVSVDGQVVHEQKGFKAGVLSPVVTADLAGAKTLTLEVDYGEGYDVQDRLNWIEPAIVREAK